MEYVGLGVFAFAHAAALALVVWMFVRDAGIDLGWMRPGDGGGGGSDRDHRPQPPAAPPGGDFGPLLPDAEQGGRLREPRVPRPLLPERRRTAEPGERPRVPA